MAIFDKSCDRWSRRRPCVHKPLIADPIRLLLTLSLISLFF